MNGKTDVLKSQGIFNGSGPFPRFMDQVPAAGPNNNPGTGPILREKENY